MMQHSDENIKGDYQIDVFDVFCTGRRDRAAAIHARTGRSLSLILSTTFHQNALLNELLKGPAD